MDYYNVGGTLVCLALSLKSEIETGHFQIFQLLQHSQYDSKSQLIDQFVLMLLGWSFNRPDTFPLCNIEKPM